jgi:hypothetical protein
MLKPTLNSTLVFLDVEALDALAVIGEPNALKMLGKRMILDLVLDLAAEVVGQILRIGRHNDRMIGFGPRYQAGKNSLASIDLPWRGGIVIIRRVISPRSTASSFLAIKRWCGASR